jgi:PAP2 superfamily
VRGRVENEGGPFPRWVLVAGILLSLVLYFPLNHAFADQHVLTTSVDESLPLVPVLSIPYLAFLPIFWLTVLSALVRDHGFTRLALSIIFAYMVSNLIYLVFHTYMPRPEDVSGFFHQGVDFVYSHDEPFNDAPSEHASSAVILVLYAWRYVPRLKWWALALSVSVVVGTLLIRQHSIAGAASGVLMGVLAWWAATWVEQRYRARRPV